MKFALIKDTFREIKKSFSRFLSVFIIVFLGCGFYSGINATMPDMNLTAEQYYEKNNLMDIRLVSTIGIKAEDIAAVKLIDCVEGVMAGYSKDVIYNFEDNNHVLKFMSWNGKTEKSSDNINNLTLVEGRYPEKSGECVVDTKFYKKDDNFAIGKTITVSSPDKNESISDTFKTDTFEIVGYVSTPLYVGYERDKTTVGNGSVYGYVFVSENDFTLDYYSEMFVTVKDCDFKPYSDEYLERVEECRKEIYNAFTDKVNVRYDALLNIYEDRVKSGEKTVSMLEEILNAPVAELEELKSQLQTAVEDFEQQAQTDTSNLLNVKITQAKTKLSLIKELITAKENNDTKILDGYKAQLEQAKSEVYEGQKQLEQISGPVTLSYNRYSSSDYGSFYDDSQKIHSIGKVFPVFFIVVAALVCLTTMTRMIEEQRTIIGTYKAMGYKSAAIASKYLIYGITASALGSFLGTLVGVKTIPVLIYECYKILYSIPDFQTPFKWNTTLVCVIIAAALTAVTVLYSCYKELYAMPSQLMRPKAPKNGKRVFLEKFPKIWNKIGFIGKVTVRNLLRYKKRFFMTVLGVAGCTALMLTGFGLKHSISAILDLQFNDIFNYSGLAMINTSEYSADSSKQALDLVEGIKSSVLSFQQSGEIVNGKENYSVTVVVSENAKKISDYVNLKNPDTGDKIALDSKGVVVTNKLAKLLDIEAGDKITVDLGEKGSFSFEVSDITENYALHYVYISPELYEETVEKPQFNTCFFNMEKGCTKDDVSDEIVAAPEILGVSFLSDNGENFEKSLSSLSGIVWLLIGCAGALAMVVLYNLANINITERIREIATVKVLGFNDGETSAYIYRENIISAVIGILTGFVMGIFLHRFVVLTAEVDIVMFERSLAWWAYLFSAILTLVFTAIVNVVLHFKLKSISMVESLKAVE